MFVSVYLYVPGTLCLKGGLQIHVYLHTHMHTHTHTHTHTYTHAHSYTHMHTHTHTHMHTLHTHTHCIQTHAHIHTLHTHTHTHIHTRAHIHTHTHTHTHTQPHCPPSSPYHNSDTAFSCSYRTWFTPPLLFLQSLALAASAILALLLRANFKFEVPDSLTPCGCNFGMGLLVLFCAWTVEISRVLQCT